MTTFEVALSSETFTSNFLIWRTTIFVAFAIAIAFSIFNFLFLVDLIVAVATDTLTCLTNDKVKVSLLVISRKRCPSLSV